MILPATGVYLVCSLVLGTCTTLRIRLLIPGTSTCTRSTVVLVNTAKVLP
jgi:hypothetical protein